MAESGSESNSSTSSESGSSSSYSDESDTSNESSCSRGERHEEIEKKQAEDTDTISKKRIDCKVDSLNPTKTKHTKHEKGNPSRETIEDAKNIVTVSTQGEVGAKNENKVTKTLKTKNDSCRAERANEPAVGTNDDEGSEENAYSSVINSSELKKTESNDNKRKQAGRKNIERSSSQNDLSSDVPSAMEEKNTSTNDVRSKAEVYIADENSKAQNRSGNSKRSKESESVGKKRSRTPKRRSGSRDRERRRRNRSITRSRSRSNDRWQKERRRSDSFERRRQERIRRHAERDAIEEGKKKNSNSNESSNGVIEDNETVSDPKAKITERQRRTVDLLTSRTGGAYIPPAKLRLMQAEITDKSSAAYQRIAWEALKKSIHGYINKVNIDNIAIITRELLKENIVRGRGLLCRSIIQAQAASPTFTHVYAALVSIINSKFPNIGELLLKRLVIQFKRAFRRNDKSVCLSSSRFVAHLVNQRVAHEILALEILTLLVETPTDDSVEVAIAFLKECGMKLTEVSSKGIGAIFEMLKNILHEGKLDKRVQYMIEVVFQVRKDGFKDHQSVPESLELVEEDDQFTHLLMLDEATNAEEALNAFKFDDKYETNEDKYKGLSKEILGSDGSDSDESGSGSGSDSESNESGASNADKDEEKATAGDIIDNTETNMIALRRTIYLTINSSLDYEECAHKLMKMQLKPGQEIELCHMFLDCCAEQRTYEKFYGLLAQRFCAINKIYIEPFEEIFKDTYQTTHRLDTNRLRNVSKFFAHLLFTDAIGWDVLECIKLNEDDTTSSSRIFIKILFQELAEYMGLGKLNSKLKDEVLTESLSGLFPKDNPRNTRFAINFFTSIGLGGLTDDLRQFLKNAPKSVPAINLEILANKPPSASSSLSSSSTSSSSMSSSSESSSSSSTSSSSDSESSESDHKKRKRKQNKKSLSKNKQKSKNSEQNKKKTDKKTKTKKQRRNKSISSGSSSGSESSESSDDQKRKKKYIKNEQITTKSEKKEEKIDKSKKKRKYENEDQSEAKKRQRCDEYNREVSRNDRKDRERKHEKNNSQNKGDSLRYPNDRKEYSKSRSSHRNDHLDNARDNHKQRTKSGKASRNGSKERG